MSTVQQPPTTPRTGWHVAEVIETRQETPSAARVLLDVSGWPGNLAGQHLDVRLTAPDGYTATRSYSIASSGDSERVLLVVDRLPGGEVSPFLVDELRVGDRLEIHGPLGGYFVWRPPAPWAMGRPVQLIAGGSGVVPLVAIARAHAEAGDATRFRLLYSVRTAADAFFTDEIEAAQRGAAPLEVEYVYTRRAPAGGDVAVGRITRDRLAAAVIEVDADPIVYVCGSTGFVERIAEWLIELGHHATAIRTERYGGS